jgi:hypothetical protein
MAEYLLHDRDKAAFINRMNKLLKQIKPNMELDSTNFIDVPGNGGENDITVFVTENPIEEKMLEMLIDKNSFSYKIKKVNLKEIVGSLRN